MNAAIAYRPGVQENALGRDGQHVVGAIWRPMLLDRQYGTISNFIIVHVGAGGLEHAFFSLLMQFGGCLAL
ncbi:hypothetical protein ABIG06_001574 [Bradyrhizobium sp. USDA 326]|uniref:hypothetical protein n=1 Tax=unclassified Bradyrhizobium TaxID=2631580 RepID=UPI0035165F01